LESAGLVTKPDSGNRCAIHNSSRINGYGRPSYGKNHLAWTCALRQIKAQIAYFRKDEAFE